MRVVTKDIVTDSFQGLRNFFGLRLRGYEAVISKSLKEMIEEMNEQYKVSWYRVDLDTLSNGSSMILVYGQGVLNE